MSNVIIELLVFGQGTLEQFMTRFILIGGARKNLVSHFLKIGIEE